MFLIRSLCLFIVLLLSGCATTANFNSVPVTASEFDKPLPDIKAEYTDVSLYERSWKRFFSAKTGNYADLETKWGKADKVEKRWGEKLAGSAFLLALVAYGALPVAGYVVIEALSIQPSENHYWNKGNTQVEAFIIRPGLAGYERKVAMWEWKKTVGDMQPTDTSVAQRENTGPAGQ